MPGTIVISGVSGAAVATPRAARGDQVAPSARRRDELDQMQRYFDDVAAFEKGLR